LNEIGVGLCSVNRQEDAIPVFDMALNFEHKEAEVLWSNKGRALAELGKSEMALDCYEEALRIEPTYALALVQSADLKHELGDLEGAVARYTEALKKDPQNHKCWFERGSALLGLDENESAIQSLDRALAINPSNKKAIYNKGVALFRLGRPEDAAVCLEKAVELDAKYANAWYLKAYIETMARSTDVAISSCKTFLRITATSDDKRRGEVEACLAELK
jgi:tetratricopeptide (TPR) repeat protein